MQHLARLVDVDGNGRVNIWQFVAAFVAHDAGTHSVSLSSSSSNSSGATSTATGLIDPGTAVGQNRGRELSHGVVQVRQGT